MLFTVFLNTGHSPLWAQQAQERVYADEEENNDCLLCLTIDVSNEGNAVDGNKDTYATMSISVIGEVWQKLYFTTELPDPNDPVHVKIGTNTGLLELLDNLTIQLFYDDDEAGDPITLGSLIGLLDGEDQVDIVVPAPGVPYNSVRIRSAGIALGGGVNIYGAYFNKPAVGVTCNTASDILWGSEADLAGGVNAVDNPQNAVDGDNTSFAELHANVSIAGKTHLTALYPATSIPGDSVRIVFQNPGGLLDLSLLSSSLEIMAYMDNEDDESDPLDLDANVLSLRLLPGEDNIQVITYPVDISFNRIQVSIGDGLATALSALRVYEIETVPKAPEITAPDIQDGEIYDICYGNDITLNVANPVSGSEYRWYAAVAGGTQPKTGTSYTVENLDETRIVYLAEVREGCTEESARTSVTVHVLPPVPPPGITAAGELYLCYGDNITLSAADPVSGSEYRWYGTATGGTPLDTGVSYDITDLEETTTYYLAEVREGCTEESARASVTVHVLPDFGNPAISILNEND
ncbi:hypothetical protein DN748_18610 [Sinomicrobium soli]|nr:hypothetical protein DN748_18610 [Sinomicrobium sp. N-1-3-6]